MKLPLLNDSRQKPMDNPFFDCSLEIFKKLDDEISENFRGEITAYCAGGFAMTYWLGPGRMTGDVDAIFYPMVNTNNISITYGEKEIFFDKCFNDTLSAMQEGFPGRAVFIKSFGRINVYVLSPEDLALMKISRWTDVDRRDVLGLIKNDLIDKERFSKIYEDVVKIYIGNTRMLHFAFEDVIETMDNIKDNPEAIPAYLRELL